MKNNNANSVSTAQNQIQRSLSEIHKLHSENLGAARMTFDRAVRIGELLAEIKSKLKHGEWLPWLKANVQFAQQTANNYTRIFRERDRLKLLTVSNLTEAYNLLAEPTEPDISLIPSWAKPAYPLNEMKDAFEIVLMTLEILAKRGVQVPFEERVELLFHLLEKRGRFTDDGIFEQFDGEKWQPMLRVF